MCLGVLIAFVGNVMCLEDVGNWGWGGPISVIKVSPSNEISCWVFIVERSEMMGDCLFLPELGRCGNLKIGKVCFNSGVCSGRSRGVWKEIQG